MSLAVFLCSAVIILFPDYANSNNVVRNKRTDDLVPCEKGWFYFREKCYKIGGRKASERVSWEKAQDRCKYFGGDLVTIQSQEEQDFITSFLQLDVKYWAWIGLHDRINESVYMWNDGSVVNYTNWRSMDPSGYKDENCVQMLFEPENGFIGKWNDNTCGHQDAYICQMKIDKKKKSPNKMYCTSEEGGGWKFQNSCYHVVTEMKSWEDAEKHCNDIYGGHLVTILDGIVDLFLDYIISNLKKELWIGIKIQDQLQQKWTSDWYVSYNGFKIDPRHFLEGTCVLRKERKEWIMVPCSKTYSFICEITKVKPPVLKLPMRGSHCPEEQNDWRDFGGEYCYHIETEKSVSWYEAGFDCKRRGGELVSLHSQEETDILQPFLKYTQRSIFIGLLRRLTPEEEFIWSDGSLLNYENWNHDEPNMDHEQCVEIWTSNMKWNDVVCGDKRGYICSVKKIEPNSTTEEPTAECEGHLSMKALIGVSVCILLVITLLGVVVYCFRPCGKPTTVSTLPPSPPRNRPKYRSATELTLRDDENYEFMG